MSDIAATNISVTMTPEDLEIKDQGGKVSYPQISLGDGSMTYPSGGIPMPPIGKFGMEFFIKRMFINPVSPANGNTYRYIRSTNKIRIFTATATEFSGAIPALVLDLTVIGQ